jgi:hypothetical protein
VVLELAMVEVVMDVLDLEEIPVLLLMKENKRGVV